MSAALREKLIDLGTSNPLFTIRPGDDCDLYLAHTIVDAKYYGIGSKERVKKQYAAKMWLVESERAVKYREVIQEQDKSIGVLPAPKLGFQKSFGKVYDYDFDVIKIRGPVKELVESNGWKFEQIIFDYRPAGGLDQRFCGQCGTALPLGAAFCTNCGQKAA